jgi:GT2 family glycosyltransferase
LRESTYSNYQLVVVDNGSSDNSVVRIRQEGGPLVLLETGENLGYTGGNNHGIEYALKNSADYIFVLNNDTFVAPDAIEKMLGVAESDVDIGVVTCKILNHPQRNLLWFGGAKYNTRYMIARHVGYGQEDGERYNQECDIPWATGCALFLRRAAIDTAGLLFDGFFLTAEDLDLCLRIKDQGYRIVYVPSAVIWHKESISAGGHDAPQYVYYQTRNLLLLHTRRASDLWQLIFSQIYALLLFLKRVLSLICRKKWRSILGVLYGIRDGFIGVVGRKDYVVLTPSKKL